MGEASDVTGAADDGRTFVAEWVEDGSAAKCGKCGARVGIDFLKLADARSQKFFVNLRESVRPGYVSDTHKQFVTTLLQQAQAAGLFDPEGT